MEEGKKEFPSPQEFVTETPPYTNLESETLDDVLGIDFYKGTIDTFCLSCNRDSVFQRKITLPDAVIGTTWRNDYGVQNLINGDVIRFNIRAENSVFEPIGTIEYDQYNLVPRLIAMEFICTRENSHKIFVFAIAKGKTIVKIGQSPSLADLQKVDARKYRKVLGDTYTELSRAIGLSAHGVGIGAYVYLRRIFEKLLEEAHDIAKDSEGWDEELYLQSRVNERIAILKDHLPEFLVKNRNLYGILSKGIHELTEEECLEYFPIVILAIELILDEKLQTLERKEKTKNAANRIAAIAGVINTVNDENENSGT